MNLLKIWAISEPDLRVLLQEINMRLDLLRMEQIVLIQKEKNFPGGSAPPRPPGRCGALIYLVTDIFDPRVIELRDNFRSMIRGYVVNNNDLQVRVCLIQHASDRITDKTGTAIGWNDYADKWSRHNVPKQSD